MVKPIWYLAAPYSQRPDGIADKYYCELMHQRELKVGALAAKFIDKGKVIFSPITHNVPLEHGCSLPPTWEFWQDFDLSILDKCIGLIVYMLPGWKESVGVGAEIDNAIEAHKEIVYISPNLLSQKSIKYIAAILDIAENKRIKTTEELIKGTPMATEYCDYDKKYHTTTREFLAEKDVCIGDAIYSNDPNQRMVGGNHYKELGIQPWEVDKAWSTEEQFLGYLRCSALEYIARWDKKSTRLENIQKAIHYLQKLESELQRLPLEK